MAARSELVQVYGPGGRLLMNMFYRISPSRDSIDVALAMVLDTDRYRAAITN
jgi:hypothetical protein